jgi:hypothetical protein
MDFNSALKKNIFLSLDHTLSLTTRKDLFDKNQKYLELFKEELSDKYEAKMYIINDFLDESKYEINTIDVLIEMNNRDFDDFIDSSMLFDYYSDYINYFFKVEDRFFCYDKENKSFNSTKLKIDNKINF